jgi:hypothetical protein
MDPLELLGRLIENLPPSPILTLVSHIVAALLYTPYVVPYILTHGGLLYAGVGFVYGYLVKKHVQAGIRLWRWVDLVMITLVATVIEAININRATESSEWLSDALSGSAIVIIPIGLFVALGMLIADRLVMKRQRK